MRSNNSKNCRMPFCSALLLLLLLLHGGTDEDPLVFVLVAKVWPEPRLHRPHLDFIAPSTHRFHKLFQTLSPSTCQLLEKLSLASNEWWSDDDGGCLSSLSLSLLPFCFGVRQCKRLLLAPRTAARPLPTPEPSPFHRSQQNLVDNTQQSKQQQQHTTNKAWSPSSSSSHIMMCSCVRVNGIFFHSHSDTHIEKKKKKKESRGDLLSCRSGLQEKPNGLLLLLQQEPN